MSVLLACIFMLAGAMPAMAHEERPVDFPDGSGSVPAYRGVEPDLIVCKTDRADFERRVSDFPAELKDRNIRLFERCQGKGFRHLQEAVNAVDKPGMNIAILPGLYLEEPTQSAPTGECARLKAPTSSFGYQILSYEQQEQCPNNQNLIAILGKTDLQIEGTGASRNDVIIDGRYRKLNVIRADMADGIYFKNFTAQRSTFNSLYILAGDGFVIDDVLTRWNDEYGFLTFASDHGLYKDCESYGNGDSGIYPGSASDVNSDRGYGVERYSMEITGCRSHHNMVGYSGTAGNSVWAHDNEFDHNMAGAAMDSAFPGHPGLPQDHSKFERNLIHDNNQDYYRHVREGTCAKPPAERGYERGVVCPQIPVPVGSGVIIAGGNYNLFQDNWIYGNQRTAFVLHAVPGFIRGEEGMEKQWDTSHHNRFIGNHLGVDRENNSRPNKTSVWWDGQGEGNCWTGLAGPGNPRTLPECGDKPGEVSGGSDRIVGEPVKLVQLLVCSEYDVRARKLPAGCDWYGARGVERIETQIAIAVAAVLALVGGVLWRRTLRHDRWGTVAAGVGLAGLVVDVIGSARPYDHSVIPAVSLLLLGLGWAGMGLRLLQRRRVFGWVTVGLGALTVLDAWDKAVVMVPWTPLSPAWLRILVGVAWVVWAVIAAAGQPEQAGDATNQSRSQGRATATATATGDVRTEGSAEPGPDTKTATS
ncbi:right-handed parallel beta-helix repeat-containing protein [Streptomyces sp. NPDC019396]|uniref:right-handed parallel beta-helix repeat-containing protein n=1 Tax=Streptomyces sp. NPDC019396 TaxID=3154687 RepID=UPI0033D67045